MADIDFLPVCSKCGSVQWGEIIDVEAQLNETSERYKYCNSYRIYPSYCKKCGERFEQVRIPTKLPFNCYLGPNNENCRS